MQVRVRVSRTRVRLALALAGAAAVAAYGVRALEQQAARAPAYVANDTTAPPHVTRIAGVTHVVSVAARDRIVPDTALPDAGAGARLLWLAGRVTSPAPNGTVVLDPGGSVVQFDHRLRPYRPGLSLEGIEAMEVAAGAGGRWWIVDAAGRLLLVDPQGAVLREMGTPFVFPSVASAPDGSDAWLVRSPLRFAYAWDPAAPLLVHISEDGSAATKIGSAELPAHVLLQDLANAGRVVVSDDRLFYVPFIRDEVVALDLTGDTLWVASRGLPQSTPEPRFEVSDGKVVINYHPVNLGASMGPDGLLYVLSTSGFTTARSRIDAFDPRTGHLLRSAELETALPTLAVDQSSRVYLLDATRLLTGVAPEARRHFPQFALATSDGDSIRSSALLGRVTLINVWASWCKPCREEMPGLDSLRRAVRDSAFLYVSVNGDVSRAPAERFLRDVGLELPFAIAGPGVTRVFRAPGLPYTALLDRDGRIVQRWLGYSGADQMTQIRAAIRLELGRQPAVAHAHHGR
ncbi:MAG: TlpA family protein disulfide reductase [Gemmatimonadaceae bacterium]|nr:TlpA family protein disulfide reductase [Gemmatimonadaceae bacterium]